MYPKKTAVRDFMMASSSPSISSPSHYITHHSVHGRQILCFQGRGLESESIVPRLEPKSNNKIIRAKVCENLVLI